MRLTSATAAGPTHRSIMLTIIVTFAASFAFLYWKQRSREAPAMVAAPLAVPQVEPRRPPPGAPSAEPAPPPEPEPPPVSPPQRPRAANPDAPALPVLYRLGHRIVRASDDASPEEMISVSDVHLSSSSDVPLFITVVDVSRPAMDTSQAQVMVGANAETQVGTDNGLRMQSGDQITLKSPGFSDVTFSIP